MRYEQVARQLWTAAPRRASRARSALSLALPRRSLLADYAGKVVASLSTGGGNGTFVGAWLAALMFMFQIYFDFSGYSDMAIGLGRIFGFRYCENFDLPYISTSITGSGARWHMSLGSFFRDYVTSCSAATAAAKARQILNLLAVWALTGLWHGASWNFVWGLYFFVLLSIEKQIAPEAGNAPVYRAQPRDDVLCAHRLGAVHEYVALRHRLGILPPCSAAERALLAQVFRCSSKTRCRCS